MAKNRRITILSVDPAISLLGYAITYYDPVTDHSVIIRYNTLDGQALLKQKKEQAGIFQKQFIILNVMEEYFTKLIAEVKPDYVAVESPFSFRNPQIYASLVLVVNTIRRSCAKVLGRDIYLIAPRECKKAVASNGNASKDDMIAAIKTSKDITIKKSASKELLTEHAADAIAVGRTFTKNYLFNILMNATVK